MDEPAPTPPARMGPLVHRAVHVGGALSIVAVVQFIIAMIVVQLQYPGYSAFGNAISDLGNPDKSPWHAVFNGSIIALGILGILAVILVRTAFPNRASSKVGLFFLGLTLLGAILVGVFPETSPELGGNIHHYVTDLTFISAGFALLILSGAMLRDTRWVGYRFYTFISAVVTFIAIILYSFDAWGALGPGGIERLIVAPVLLWGIVVGIHVLRLPAYAPRLPRPVTRRS
jgi:hypothetical membrane protein